MGIRASLFKGCILDSAIGIRGENASPGDTIFASASDANRAHRVRPV